MQKETVVIKKLNESFIKIKHESGLLILLKPMKEFSSACAIFTTKFGSVYESLLKEEKKTVLPAGVAHYLEHKLFENKDGSVTFELFSKEKAMANAETSFKNTSYYFSSLSENFNAALKILLDFVQNPYFTDENVEKERGIIAQEIKMYEDGPEWASFFNCLCGLYEKSSVKLKIAGSVDSIAKITKEVLYSCYEMFYNPSNMALIIAGNFNEEEVLQTICGKIKNKGCCEFRPIFEKEPAEVTTNYVEKCMPVKTSMFHLGYKLVPKKSKQLLEFVISLEILCELLFGEGSTLCKFFYDEGLVFGGEVEYYVLHGENYLALILSGETNDPKKVLEKISEEIELKKRVGFEEEDFILVKKTKYKKIIKKFSTPEKIANFLSYCYVENFLEFDFLETIKKLELESLSDVLKEIETKNFTFSVVKPFEV